MLSKGRTLLSSEYAAGFFDGEGCVQLRYGKSAIQYHKQIIAAVGQSSLPVLEALKEKYGGSIYQRKMSNCGIKQMWDWKVYTVTCCNFFEDILPHAIVKQEQIAFALEGWKVRGDTNLFIQKTEEYKARWGRQRRVEIA
jgi:hypothetical protein